MAASSESGGAIKDAVFARPRGQAEQAERRGPVWWNERFDGWAVASHALVTHVVRSPEVFSSDELRTGPVAPHAESPVLRSLIALDPPEHHRLRRVVSQAFTPRAVARAEDAIERTAGHLLRTQPADRLEVVEAFASPLTVTMLAALLGVPETRRADFVRWTHVVAAFIGPAAENPERRDEFRRVVDDLEGFLHGSLAARSAASDTVLDTLTTACEQGDLTERELLDFMILLIVAGHETTTRLIYHAVLCLERYPDELDALRADPQRVGVFLEEVARFLPPTGGTDRFTTTDITLGDQPIAAGERVVALISAANRDPEAFPDPHRFDSGRFDPARSPSRHLGFGLGVHACLGAHLARSEARIALGGLLGHVPGHWQLPAPHIEYTETPVGIDIHRMVLTTG